jgi:hypothetical protein
LDLSFYPSANTFLLVENVKFIAYVILIQEIMSMTGEKTSAGIHQRRGRKKRTVFARILLWPLLLVLSGWASVAIYYSNLPDPIRPAGALLFGISSVGVLLLVRPWRRAVAVFLAGFAIVLLWWLARPPSNERDWRPDAAVLPYASINGDLITIHNIRNCDYRSETDYTVRLYDKTLHLANMRSVDLFLAYWDLSRIAHTMLSFGFDGGDYVCFSIETRFRKGEEFSPIKGFFNQYELIYVVGDERDVVRLRTNYRKEDVYLYRLKVSMQMAKAVFLDYLHHVNRLKDRPEWYNALTSNCTTNIRGHMAPYNPDAKFDWRIIINGLVDEFVYEQGVLDQSLPFPELKALSHINARGQAADQDPNFSQRIREGLPSPKKD